MKKSVLALVVFTLAFVGVSSAEPLPRRSFTFGPEAYYYVYEEESVGVELDGVFIGLGATGNIHFDNRMMVQGELRGAFAEVNYDSDQTGSADGSDDEVWEGRLLVGYDYTIEDDRIYTIYSGLGWRNLTDDSAGQVTSTGHFGYGRESTYYYLPIGLQGVQHYASGWRVQVQFEVDVLLDGEQQSDLSDVSPLLSDVTNDQSDGLGFRISCRFQKLGQKYNFFVEPFFRYWKIEDSRTSTISVAGIPASLGLEPENTTTELGANCSLIF